MSSKQERATQQLRNAIRAQKAAAEAANAILRMPDPTTEQIESVYRAFQTKTKSVVEEYGHIS